MSAVVTADDLIEWMLEAPGESWLATLADVREVKAKIQEARAREECPGIDRCHGPVRWCDRCGDVDKVCDMQPGTCAQHHMEDE